MDVAVVVVLPVIVIVIPQQLHLHTMMIAWTFVNCITGSLPRMMMMMISMIRITITPLLITTIVDLRNLSLYGSMVDREPPVSLDYYKKWVPF